MEPSIKPVAVPHSDLVEKIKTAHSAVITGMKDTVMKSMALGDILIAAKDRMPHGAFLPWVENACGIASTSAQLYMRHARNRPKIEEAMRNAQGNAHFTLADANKAIGSSSETKPAPDAKAVVESASDKHISALNELKQSSDASAMLE